MNNMDKKRAEVCILKAKAVIAEKELAILDREEEIGRLKLAIEKQELIIIEQEKKLGESDV